MWGYPALVFFSRFRGGALLFYPFAKFVLRKEIKNEKDNRINTIRIIRSLLPCFLRKGSRRGTLGERYLP